MIKVGMKPSHPGEFIRRQVLEPLGLTITTAAKVLDVRRATLNDLVNGKSSLSAEMALRMEKAFDVNMDFLLRMQALYDGYCMREKSDSLKVQRYQHG
ncbi:MAG TPA: HigA family addiction module antitoxin [Thermodesulfobacteriota bacterium]